MDHIRLPQLYSPFPSGLNLHADSVGRETIAWARHFNLVTEDIVERRLATTHIGGLVGRVYLSTPRAQLQLLADWTTWLFLQDDQCDELGISKQPTQLQAIHARSLAVLRGAHPTLQDRPLTHALSNLRLRMLQYADAEWMSRFIASFEECLTASIWEATNRARGTTPDVTTYLQQRALTGGLYPYIVLIELTEQIHLPRQAREHPTVERLTLMAVNVVCWANDILSLAKEIKQGDVHNLVLTLQHKHRLTLQEALERAAALHDTEVRAFIDLELRLPSFGAPVDAALKQYIAILRSWMRGNLDWSYTSGRYLATAEVPGELAHAA